MEKVIELISNQRSGYSIRRRNKLLYLTRGEVTDCFIYALDSIAYEALKEAIIIKRELFTEEVLTTLSEEVVQRLIKQIEAVINQVLSDVGI